MAYTLRCTFRPQSWGRGNKDALYEVEGNGPLEWTTTVEKLPEVHSYESDDLIHAESAPQWCRDWPGPFEVDYEVLTHD